MHGRELIHLALLQGQSEHFVLDDMDYRLLVTPDIV
jgi:hypothetical protein